MDQARLLENFHLMDDGKSPFYKQLAMFFKEQIHSGIIKEGEQLITEDALCDILGISRTTVRQAIRILVEDGLVYRHSGKGTFVTKPKLTRNINHLYGFSEDMKSLKKSSCSVVLKSEVINTADSSILDALKLSKNDKIFHLERIRLSDDIPLLIESSYIPYFLCYGIEKMDFSHSSLYSILKDTFSISIYHAKESYEAVKLEKKQAELLNCNVNALGFKINRISNLESGTVCEYTTSLTRADICKFEIDMYGSDVGKNNIEFQRRLNVD